MERNLERVHLIRWENLPEKIQRKCRDFSFYRIPRLLIKNLSYSSCAMQRKPYGGMVSSTDQTPQAPFMLFLIRHYFERPASSVRLVKSIHLRAYRNIVLSMNCNKSNGHKKRKLLTKLLLLIQLN